MPLPPDNLLAAEASPYLRQHAANPVHWRPWGEAALAEARELDRPILLSVGYAACHWCHVMAHESFEDEAVAAVMNRLFVNIKVDREERPDVDQIYMTALAATGEQGGWPLTMFLTPSAEPFWGGTYFPREPRYGRPGFIQVLEAIGRAWDEKKAAIAEDAARLTAHVARQVSPDAAPGALSPEVHAALADSILAATDTEKGGLRGAPKFPNAPYMTALWLHWLRTGDTRHRDAFLTSLAAMLNGGIYDHVGGGLCRYSTDADWTVPHFEKMLYDNAQLITLCGWALGATGNDLFRRRIEQTVSWLCREMRSDGGLFTSSLDADSEGVEGKYYTWNREEIEQVLGHDAEDFFAVFVLASPPGWEGEKAILRRAPTPDRLMDEDRLAGLLERLRQARDRRIRPARDDKAILEWNGLAIRALAQAARQLGRPDWLSVAETAFRTATESILDGRLPHSRLGERRQFPGLSGDYGSLINAAVALHEATGAATYTERAAMLLRALDRWHGDGGDGYFLTPSDAGDLPMRVRGDVDEATSSANALVIEAIGRLAAATGDPVLAATAERVAAAAASRAATRPHGQAGILNAGVCVMEPHRLIMVEADRGPLFVPEANRVPDPRRVDVVIERRDGAAPRELPDGTVIDAASPAAYLCLGTRCLTPVESAEALRSLLVRSVANA